MKLKYIIPVLAAVAAVSCQKADQEFDSNLDPNAVRVEATVGGAFTRSNPIDETNSAAFKSGDVISVAADAQTAVSYTLNGTAWSPESGKYLKWETDAMTFKAYYPVGANNASMLAFDVPADQSTLAKVEKADYMTYEGSQSKTESVSLTLKRQMARVVVDNITFNDQYATGYTVESITVHGNTSGYANGSTKSGNVDVQSYKQEGKFYALLSPTTVDATTAFLTVTVKKTADGSTETLTVKGIPALEAGKSYVYTVKVGKNTLNINNITVEDWTTGTPIPGGEAVVGVEVDPNTHTLTVITEGTLKAKHITAALAGGTVLAVKGTLNANDVTTLTATSTLTTIDLQGVQYTGGTIPTADWSACTNLTKIIIAPADATDYEIKWSAAIGKLFHLGKMDYNHTALDGQTYICKVISLSTSSVTVVHLKKQTLNNSIGMTRAVAQAAIDTKDARFLKKAEFEQLVLDGTITVAGSENVFCHEDCAGWYMDSKFGYQATSRDPNLTACYFLVFDL